MSTSNNSSVQNETITSEQAGGGILTNMTTPQEGDISSLTHAIVEWRRIVEEVSDYRQRVRERTKKMKALEEVILRVMKSHNIGALDMKSSGGRVLFKKTKRQGGIGGKKLKEHLVGFLKSEQQANAAIEYINANRGTVVKESLILEIDG
jgi:hypothetical protein